MNPARRVNTVKEAYGALSTIERDDRQRVVAEWCARAFGVGQASSVPQRALRLLEEAVEAAQAAGCDPAMAHRLVDYVFGRPPGDLASEIGGVSVTLLALAQAAGMSAEYEEQREVARVLAKPIDYFTARNAAKCAAGFLVDAEQDLTARAGRAREARLTDQVKQAVEENAKTAALESWAWSGPVCAGRLAHVEVSHGHVGIEAADGGPPLGEVDRTAALAFALRAARGFR